MGARIEAGIRPGIRASCPPPSALRASLRLFQIAAGDFVKIDILTCEHCGHAVKPSIATTSQPAASMSTQGNIHYRLKTPYRDGTTDVVFEPLDFMARLTALVPTPRVNLTRYHGVFAPSGRFS